MYTLLGFDLDWDLNVEDNFVSVALNQSAQSSPVSAVETRSSRADDERDNMTEDGQFGVRSQY